MIKTAVEEGGPLATTVKAVVLATLKPLEDEVKDFAKEVRGQEAAAEALQQTTEKGHSYEEQVVEELAAWARPLGVEVHHVGKDNMPGDVLIVPNGSSTASCALKS